MNECDRAPADVVEWALRYLDVLDAGLDGWQADCFRRGCCFLSKGMATGAASAWTALHLPPDRRVQPSGVPAVARPMTPEEEDRLRAMLFRIARSSINRMSDPGQ
jgi:hypothetical protein